MRVKNPLTVAQADQRYAREQSGSVVIAPSASVDVDTVSLSADGKHVDWHLHIDDGAGKTQSLDINAHAEGASAEHSIYGVLGDAMSLVFAVTSDGTDMKLTITNNEANSITVRYARVAV